jgi:murein DD-endopeptidase MepM/ murein hydrolase activator NlpD
MAVSVTPLSFDDKSSRTRETRFYETSPTKSFQELIDKIEETKSKNVNSDDASYVVIQGDTLSSICARDLRRNGENPSMVDIAQAVSEVAKANGVQNPNLIQVGQKLNLGVIRTSSAPASGGPNLLNSTPSQELTRLIQSLTGKVLIEKAGDASSRDGESVSAGLLEAPSWVSSKFGSRKNPFGGGIETHSGVDLAVEAGTGVHAWKNGVVEFSGWQPDYGKVVIVAHDDGTESVYAHNSKNLVEAGEKVTSTTRIALSGSTGRSTGPHLHFEVRKDGKAINPDAFLNDDGLLQIAKAL